jgi:hypothetical protein
MGTQNQDVFWLRCALRLHLNIGSPAEGTWASKMKKYKRLRNIIHPIRQGDGITEFLINS